MGGKIWSRQKKEEWSWTGLMKKAEVEYLWRKEDREPTWNQNKGAKHETLGHKGPTGVVVKMESYVGRVDVHPQYKENDQPWDDGP